MVQRTSIEWTDRSANPIRAKELSTGKIGWHCEKESPGCANCYSEVLNRPYGTKLPYTKRSRSSVEIFLDRQVLHRIIRLRKPQKIFLCDMTDIFLPSVPDEMLDEIFAAMAIAKHHTFQLLTKHPHRANEYLSKRGKLEDIYAHWYGYSDGPAEAQAWPLPNVWLGTSVENQAYADLRIRELVQTPAAIRFLSCEPLLGPIDFRGFTYGPNYDYPSDGLTIPTIDWVIVGGESGRKARPMHPGWARSIRDQCVAASIPLYFKQWGEWLPFVEAEEIESVPSSTKVCLVKPDGRVITPYSYEDRPGHQMAKVGKKAAGRTLDGRTWDEYPGTSKLDKQPA